MSPAPKWKPLTSVCEDALGVTWKYRLKSADGKTSWEFTPQEAADIIGASIDREVKGADLGLPDGYADWVEVPKPLKSPFRPDGVHIEIQTMRYEPERLGGYIGYPVRATRYFVPPKPKPTLPDVRPGTVLDFKNTYGMRCRAVRGYTSWTVFAIGGRVSNGHGSYEWTNEELLGYISGEYTVVLDGLA